MSEWEKVAEVGVDSGGLVLIDPCYLRNEEDMSKWYDREYCTEEAMKKLVKPIQDGLGVTMHSGYGDGCYNVFVRYTPEGGPWGKRVAAMKVVFVEEEEDEDGLA